MAAFGPVLLLPWLTPFQALAIAAVLVGMNAFALPRLLPSLYRPGEPGRGALEIILYPVAVMASLAAYGLPAAPAGGPGKPAWYLVPALAWFALAVCDAWAGIGGRLLRRGPVLPWNPRKTLAGAAFGLLASGLCLALLVPALARAGWPWPGEAGSLLPALAVLLVAAALVETAWFGIADNLVLPFAVCAAVPLLPSPFNPAGGVPAAAWPVLVAPVGFAALAYASRQLTAGGAALGALLTYALLLAEPRLALFLGGFFVLGVAATRWRYGAKAERRIAEGRKGRRDAAQVFGAMGAAVWMTPLVHLAHLAGRAGGGTIPAGAAHGALLVCAAPFVAKAMDTVSSELGKAVGGTTLSLHSFRRVPPGTEGGVSLAGTAWGLAAAVLLAAAVPMLGWGGWAEAAALVGIAFAANLFESYWGEWAARRGIDSGPHANFLMTLFAALLAWAVWIGIPSS